MTEPVSEAAALAIVFDRLNTEVDAAKRNPDKPPCPITMLRVYIREDLRAAGLTEYADKLDARILRLR